MRQNSSCFEMSYFLAITVKVIFDNIFFLASAGNNLKCLAKKSMFHHMFGIIFLLLSFGQFQHLKVILIFAPSLSFYSRVNV